MAGADDGFAFDRRTFLLGAAALSTVGVGRGATAPRALADQLPSPVAGVFAPDVPEDVGDPSLVSTHGTPPLTATRGWEAADRTTVTESLLDLGPDVLSVQDLTGFAGPPLAATYAHRHTVIGRFAYRWGLPHSSGFTRILETDTVHEGWYRDRPRADRWRRPDGSVVEHPRELAARTFEGEPHLWAEGTASVVPSVFAPGTLDYEARIGRQIYRLGVNQLFVDGFELARLMGNDFSVWARAAFRDHLDSLPASRLDELGIDDPAAFEIQTYLEGHGLAPGQGTANPATDPVYREYTRRHHQRHKRYAEQLAERTKAGAPDVVADAGTTFFGNQAGIAGPRAAPIYLSDAVDTIDIEVDPTLPPDRPHDVTVKTGLAAGRFEKPVRIEGKMHRIRAVDTRSGLDPGQPYPVLMQFQVAQAYAHGGLRGLSLSSWADVPEGDVVNNWVRPDGSIADSLQRFTDFVRASERWLVGLSPANDVALVVSLPTLIWQRAPQWDRHAPDHSNAVRGAAAVLRRAQLPYDVVVFDYPPVWEAEGQLERLEAYELVVLPGVESISDAQVASLEAALTGGTSVIATGGAPDRDEEYRDRDDVRALIDRATAGRILASNPERDEAGAGRAALRDALPSSRRQVELATDGDVSVNVMGSAEGEFVVVHLVNYEYDPGTDRMATRSDLQVTIRGLPFDPVGASYHSPSGVTDIEVSSDGDVASVEIPKLDVWGFVVFRKDPSTGTPAATRLSATQRIEAARNAIATAAADGRRVRLVRARAGLANAERAREHGGFDAATRLAEAATAAAEDAYRRPVIGIDRAHNQSTAVYESDLGTLREAFASFEYREVATWTDESLGAIDVLVVPPILPEADREYGFSSSDLDALDAYVRAGGSLLLLGSHRPKPGFNRLAGRFGFGLDGRPINRGEGDVWGFDVESPLSAVTAFIPRWGGRFGTTLATIESGTVLGRVRAGSPAWLTSEGPTDERGPDEPSAAGEPVLAGRAYGRGHVVVSGEAWQFVEPTLPDGTPAPLPEQLLRTLGRRARRARRTGGRSPTTTESTGRSTDAPTTPAAGQSPTSTPSARTPSTTSASGQPGLGFLAGLIGILGGWWYRRRNAD